MTTATTSNIKTNLTVLKTLEEGSNQLSVIEELVNGMEGISELARTRLLRSVQVREMSSSTYIGHGLAIPHARMEDIDELSIVVGYSRGGVDWPDGDSRARLIILLAIPHSYVQAYLMFMKKFVSWYSKIDDTELERHWRVPGQLQEDIEELLAGM